MVYCTYQVLIGFKTIVVMVFYFSKLFVFCFISICVFPERLVWVFLVENIIGRIPKGKTVN